MRQLESANKNQIGDSGNQMLQSVPKSYCQQLSFEQHEEASYQKSQTIQIQERQFMPSAPQVPKGKAKPTFAFDNLSGDSDEDDQPNAHQDADNKGTTNLQAVDFQIDSGQAK